MKDPMLWVGVMFSIAVLGVAGTVVVHRVAQESAAEVSAAATPTAWASPSNVFTSKRGKLTLTVEQLVADGPWHWSVSQKQRWTTVWPGKGDTDSRELSMRLAELVAVEVEKSTAAERSDD